MCLSVKKITKLFAGSYKFTRLVGSRYDLHSHRCGRRAAHKAADCVPCRRRVWRTSRGGCERAIRQRASERFASGTGARRHQVSAMCTQRSILPYLVVISCYLRGRGSISVSVPCSVASTWWVQLLYTHITLLPGGRDDLSAWAPCVTSRPPARRRRPPPLHGRCGSPPRIRWTPRVASRSTTSAAKTPKNTMLYFSCSSVW